MENSCAFLMSDMFSVVACRFAEDVLVVILGIFLSFQQIIPQNLSVSLETEIHRTRFATLILLFSFDLVSCHYVGSQTPSKIPSKGLSHTSQFSGCSPPQKGEDWITLFTEKKNIFCIRGINTIFLYSW